MQEISKVSAREILDSRGNPTVEVDVHLADGTIGRAAVPSGASTGTHEAVELRDGDQSRFLGKGVLKAVANVTDIIGPAVAGMDAGNQRELDKALIDLDGTENKGNLGANSILGVSMAVCRAAAASSGISLFQHLSHGKAHLLPIPMMNILNGGSHADNNIDIQEFMIVPTGFTDYKEALRAGVEIFHSLKTILKKNNLNTSIGDEGGFAPMLRENEEALDLIMEAINQSGYQIKKEINLALDVAASELYSNKKQTYLLNNRDYAPLELIKYYKKLCSEYPIISIEDGLDQNDWGNWETLNTQLGGSVQIVGDDLTVTNPELLKEAINKKAINAILIKLNQIGTFSETLETINLAQQNNLGVIISHRSGETEDTFISDLAVASNAGQIKTGSLCRTDRTAKYNQLLRIEKTLGSKTIYGTQDF